MTKIDRYVLTLFLRTSLITFCSLAGIFIVFSAFTSMDDLVKLGETQGGLLPVMLRHYGPFMLQLFDWTGSIIAMMAFLFTVGWLRRTGELTSTLAAGISHGRLLRPIVIASLLIVGLQWVNRELVIPKYRDLIASKPGKTVDTESLPIKAKYDKINRVLIDGGSLNQANLVVADPIFRLDGDYEGFGDLLLAQSATWVDEQAEMPSGYLLDKVQRPSGVDSIKSQFWNGQPVLMTSHDQTWLKSRQCFFATTVSPDLLRTSQNATGRSSIGELIGRISNPAVHNSSRLHVLLHERMVRPPLDFAMILLVLPMVVNRRGRNVFVMIAMALFTVLAFFLIKAAASTVGAGGFLISPAMAAWIPLVIVGPIAYVRLREVQTV